MADGRIEIEIVLDDGKIVKGLGKIENTAKDSGSKAGGAFATGFAVAVTERLFRVAEKAIGVMVGGFQKAVDAAKDYESVVNDLNIALASTGKFTRETSDGFREFADGIQKTTKFSDDAVLSTAALLQNLGNLSEKGLKEATTATLDLATALNIDLKAATVLVGKAASGEISSFTRYGLVVKKGADNAETFANTLQALSKFQGASQKSAETLAGAMAKLNNAFDDIFKELGRVVSKSPAVITTINEISKVFSGLADSVKFSIGNKDIFKDLLINLSIIIQATVETGRQIAQAFELAFLRAQQAWLAFKVLTTLGLSEAFNTELNNILMKIEEVKASFNEDSGTTIFFDNLITKLQETSGKLTEFSSGVTNMKTSVASTVGELSEALKARFAEIDAAYRNGLMRTISAAAQAVGASLVKGAKAFDDFGNQVLGIIGDMAIQIGTTLVAIGIGIDALKASLLKLTGGYAIAAGLALIAVGGLLKSLSSQAVSNSVGGGAAPISSSPGFDEQPGLTGGEQVERSTSVTVNVDGTVLDPVAVGTQIAELLAEITDSNDINVRTG